MTKKMPFTKARCQHSKKISEQFIISLSSFFTLVPVRIHLTTHIVYLKNVQFCSDHSVYYNIALTAGCLSIYCPVSTFEVRPRWDTIGY